MKLNTQLYKLTSVDEGVNVFNFSDGWMVAVCHQGLHRVQEAVHIDDGPVVLDPVLQHAEPPPSVIVGYCLITHSRNITFKILLLVTSY